MEDITITPVEDGEIPRLAKILAGADFWQRKGYGYDKALSFLGSYDPAVGEMHVARSGGDAVGLVWFTPRGTFYEFAYIYLLAVADGFRGRGVGAKLMSSAEERVGKGSSAVFLLVSDFNSGARRFYERLGYRSCGAIPKYKGGANDEIIMWKADWL